MDGPRLLEALAARTLGRALLEAASAGDAQAQAWLVGGAVRDLLTGREPAELDVAVEGDPAALLRALGDRLGAGARNHDRFGTATLDSPQGRIDVARTRTERYASPGALPDVSPAGIEDDLARRDFTVNAIAVALAGPRRGELLAVPRATEDLVAARLRILHPASFIDDPTRLLRLARYAGRLGYEIEPETRELARQAAAGGALDTVSGSRVGAELRLLLAEPARLAALAWIERLGVLAALHPGLRVDADLAEAALALLPADGRPDLLVLAACAVGASPPQELRAWLDRLAFAASDRDVVVAAAAGAAELARALWRAGRPSQVRAAAERRPAEAVAVAGAFGAQALAAPDAAEAETNARGWLERWRSVHLDIGGDDLVAAGIPAGPEIGRRLALTLDRRLDGELGEGREAELRAALEGVPAVADDAEGARGGR
jgi:tRNA nucleotidyltransferase (CCA-adding enzyme)